MLTKIFKKLFSAIAITFLAIAIAGCYDLGEFDDEDAYYAAFGDVRLVYAEEGKITYKEYPVEDYFYNKETVNDFTYGDPSKEKKMPQLPYTYMAVPIKQNISIDSLTLYINATQTCSLVIQIYLVDYLPDDGEFTSIKFLRDPEYQQKLDEEESVYSDPDESFMVGKLTTYTQQGRWTSFTVNRWNNENALTVKKKQYILLRFINNGGLATEKTPSVSFRTTNLLVRALPKS